MKISGSVFADRNEQVEKTNFELELMKIVDCVLGGHGNYTSNLKSFKMKSSEVNRFLNSKETCIYYGLKLTKLLAVQLI